MGCIYTNNETPKSEVVHEIEKIRETENCNHDEITNNHDMTSMKMKTSSAWNNIQKEKAKIYDFKRVLEKDKNFLNQEEIVDTILDYKENNENKEPSLYNHIEDNLKMKSIKKKIIKHRNAKIFAEQILIAFNSVRTNPIAFADKLEKLMKNIKPYKNKTKFKSKEAYKFVLEYSDSGKIIGLPSGELGFIKAIKHLRSSRSLHELQWNEEIYIDFEIDNPANFEEIIKEKADKIRLKFPLFSMHLDVVKDPELSAILQIVDDTRFNGHRRETILNPKFNFMSLSQAKDNNKQLYTLITFA